MFESCRAHLAAPPERNHRPFAERSRMAAAPEGLTLAHDRDLQGRKWHPYVRWALLAALTGLLVAALLNAFGQRPETVTVDSPAASLSLYAPTRLRSGLYYEARFEIRAHSELEDAFLVLDPGWGEGMTINTIEPSPISEASRDGKFSFELGHIRAGRRYLLFIQLQVNPTNIGQHNADVVLYDGQQRLASIDRKVTVFG
jgi:hypothetical protein